MREQRLTGLDGMRAATRLLQGVRARHRTAGVFEAADVQWWWRSPRSTDDTGHLFWLGSNDTIVAGAIFTAWNEAVALDPVVLDANSRPDLLRHVCERSLEHASEHGLGPLEVAVAADDRTTLDVLTELGVTHEAEEGVDAWLDVADRHRVAELPEGYRSSTRADTLDRPHHLAVRSGPEVESRLRQTSLYRDDLDLVVLDPSGEVAAYGLFWLDPTTRTGLVEPMRTEEAHQGRGLARHVITAGIERLTAAGARRVKIACDPTNAPAHHLYTSVGFGPWRRCLVRSGTA